MFYSKQKLRKFEKRPKNGDIKSFSTYNISLVLFIPFKDWNLPSFFNSLLRRVVALISIDCFQEYHKTAWAFWIFSFSYTRASLTVLEALDFCKFTGFTNFFSRIVLFYPLDRELWSTLKSSPFGNYKIFVSYRVVGVSTSAPWLEEIISDFVSVASFWVLKPSPVLAFPFGLKFYKSSARTSKNVGFCDILLVGFEVFKSCRLKAQWGMM